jgi:hypothetical protein
MSEHSSPHDATGAATPAGPAASGKAPWHPPTLEEVDYSATEAAGVGAVYDLTVYTGSV